MHILQAAITGTIQGLSEFLPISSSAHIVFSNKLYEIIAGCTNVDIQEEIFFGIVVHLATLFAVLIYFFNDIKEIFTDFFVSINNKNYENKNFKLVNYVIIATIITGLVGILLKEIVEKTMCNPKVMCVLLFITGLILLFSEKMYKGDKNNNLKTTILIALAQGLAIFPGFSRSGLTISTALFCGMQRIEAARFSFLISIPIILLASLIYPLFELDFLAISNFNHKAMLVGFFTSFVVGYFCIKCFMKLLARLSLKTFGYYCLVVAVVMFVLFQACCHQ